MTSRFSIFMDIDIVSEEVFVEVNNKYERRAGKIDEIFDLGSEDFACRL